MDVCKLFEDPHLIFYDPQRAPDANFDKHWFNVSLICLEKIYK